VTSANIGEEVLAVAKDHMEKGIDGLGLEVDATQQERLLRYLMLLEKWNRVYNLTAIRDFAKMVSTHVLDSLSVIPLVSSGSVLDVGTGAGLPGIPIAVAKPQYTVTLLDSSHKKAAFLRQAIGELELKNATVVCERVESSAAPKRGYDTIISRAFADLGEFVSVSGRLLAPRGVIAAMKGLYPFEELERVPAGFKVREVKALQIPGLEAERHLVLVERA
jgi:16S rRNA (guanine527-N7)-methyltransferase